MSGSFVTSDTGTGLVHCAPSFGEDDFNLVCNIYKLFDPAQIPMPLDHIGNFTSEVTDFKGLYIKEADKQIIKNLKEKGRIIYQGTYTHSYPYCWRTDTPLIYKAVPSWFIKVTDLKS